MLPPAQPIAPPVDLRQQQPVPPRQPPLPPPPPPPPQTLQQPPPQPLQQPPPQPLQQPPPQQLQQPTEPPLIHPPVPPAATQQMQPFQPVGAAVQLFVPAPAPPLQQRFPLQQQFQPRMAWNEVAAAAPVFPVQQWLQHSQFSLQRPPMSPTPPSLMAVAVSAPPPGFDGPSSEPIVEYPVSPTHPQSRGDRIVSPPPHPPCPPMPPPVSVPGAIRPVRPRLQPPPAPESPMLLPPPGPASAGTSSSRGPSTSRPHKKSFHARDPLWFGGTKATCRHKHKCRQACWCEPQPGTSAPHAYRLSNLCKQSPFTVSHLPCLLLEGGEARTFSCGELMYGSLRAWIFLGPEHKLTRSLLEPAATRREAQAIRSQSGKIRKEAGWLPSEWNWEGIWNGILFPVLRHISYVRFVMNPAEDHPDGSSQTDYLRSTNPHPLRENTNHPQCGARKGKGGVPGKNLLGKAHMAVRASLCPDQPTYQPLPHTVILRVEQELSLQEAVPVAAVSGVECLVLPRFHLTLLPGIITALGAPHVHLLVVQFSVEMFRGVARIQHDCIEGVPDYYAKVVEAWRTTPIPPHLVVGFLPAPPPNTTMLHHQFQAAAFDLLVNQCKDIAGLRFARFQAATSEQYLHVVSRVLSTWGTRLHESPQVEVFSCPPLEDFPPLTGPSRK